MSRRIGMTQMLIVLYKQPDDPAKFEEYYQKKHLPLAARALKGLIASQETARVLGNETYYRVTVIRLPEGKTVEELMKSEGMTTVLADLKNFVAEGGSEALACQSDG
ncbi:MAG: EthD family reductase [Candidatus Bathyarchaeia archaeon]